MSNLVVGGHTTIANISTPYDNLTKRHGIKVVKDMVASIDLKAKNQKYEKVQTQHRS